ncbi:30S ribosome-binding factor RbfA [Propionimicrobium lymphophilum]|uniref:30S ribosome-binding factor RbfA n=1 Tax=Propionimicrobium lymphophilum TaxID=33012 RepID=UPI0023F029E3|nr:30S ribosome-binding factor RbfA [Propionimicrobium lymphophilum]
MTNPRIGKIADQIRKIIAQLLERRVKDPRLGFVTITDVRVTGDGREATVFYTDFGSSLDGREADAVDGKTDTVAALESAKGMMRSVIGKKLGMKFVPTLTFVPDGSQESAREIEELLDRVRIADEQLASQRGDKFAGDADPYRADE